MFVEQYVLVRLLNRSRSFRTSGRSSAGDSALRARIDRTGVLRRTRTFTPQY
ncbi:hypothetical protein HMPREF3227_00932 [Corynebacterium sp. CMW7794]|nr:hypothetical protein HMPREF0307_00998 [Corynebacterium sp. DNF00584]KXI18605.1 hypothetical protein HMPREF3227_00932 [Corynebacterium sp. CMW7794]